MASVLISARVLTSHGKLYSSRAGGEASLTTDEANKMSGENRQAATARNYRNDFCPAPNSQGIGEALRARLSGKQ